MTAPDFEFLDEMETDALVLAVYPQFELDAAEELREGSSSATAARPLIQRAA